jgi:hypothetical protein
VPEARQGTDEVAAEEAVGSVGFHGPSLPRFADQLHHAQLKYILTMARFELNKRYCVYVDWTLEESPRIFYVGEGKQKRVNEPRRNRVHAGLVARFGVRREVVAEFDVLQIARDYETSLIILHGTHAPSTGWGANLKLRDQHPTLLSQTPESNLKRSLALKGRPKAPFSEEHRQNISDAKKGRKLSLETRAKMSVVRKGRKQGESHSANLALSRARKRAAQAAAVSSETGASSSVPSSA